jgi:hypothetical protein
MTQVFDWLFYFAIVVAGIGENDNGRDQRYNYDVRCGG